MYSVILADPPWWYNNRKTGGERKPNLQLELEGKDPKFGGGARKHYPLMRDQELLDLAPYVKAISDQNCALFMWATMPRLDFGIELLKQWGFRYATTAFVWVKTSPKTERFIYGPGYYTASNTEIVLLGIKGSMAPVKKMVPSIIKHARLEHSVKPEIHNTINEIYPYGRKLEMFARKEQSGWDSIGNGVSDLDIQEELESLLPLRQLNLGGNYELVSHG